MRVSFPAPIIFYRLPLKYLEIQKKRLRPLFTFQYSTLFSTSIRRLVNQFLEQLGPLETVQHSFVYMSGVTMVLTNAAIGMPNLAPKTTPFLILMASRF